VILCGNLQTLLDFKYNHRFKAEDGSRGDRIIVPAAGHDYIIEVPCGTIIYDAETGELLGDLPAGADCVSQQAVGGLGNKHFLSNRNRAPCPTRVAGEQRLLRLELKPWRK